MESPIRVYRLRPRVGRKRLFDALSAIVVSLLILCLKEGADYLFAIPFLGYFSLWFGLGSFMTRRRKRVRFSLYHDRIEWIGLWGGLHSTPLDRIGTAQPYSRFQGDDRGNIFSVPQDELRVSNELIGFGDLCRRLEGARQGWSTRDLPPSDLPWNGPVLFRYQGWLRLAAYLKSTVAVVTLLLNLSLAGTSMFLPSLIVPLVFLIWAIFDFAKLKNARIERVGDRLVHFNRWNRPNGSVGIATLNYIQAPTHPLINGGRIEGDDGYIDFSANLRGVRPLLEHGYAIIADRHWKAFASPNHLNPSEEEFARAAPIQAASRNHLKA